MLEKSASDAEQETIIRIAYYYIDCNFFLKLIIKNIQEFKYLWL